jgi:hypothetical protein
VDDDFKGIAESKDSLPAHVKESINMNLYKSSVAVLGPFESFGAQ